MAQGDAQILVLAFQALDGGELAGAAQQRVGGAGEFAVVRQMRALGLAAPAGLVEALTGVLGDGLQEPVAHRAVRRRGGHHQGLVDEGAERIQGCGSAHGLGGGEVAAAREDGQPPQHVAFVLVEQFPRPVDDRPQGLLAGADGAAAGGEQAEAVVQPVRDLAWGEHAEPGGGEFDGEREAVEAQTDLGAGRGGLVVGVDAEAGPGGGAPVGEQPQRDGLGQRLDGPQQLPRYAEGFAAGGQHRQLRAALQQFRDEAGGGLDDVLAVVEDQQHPALAAVLGEPLDGVVVPVGPGPHGLGAGAVQHGLAGADSGEYGLRYGLGVVDRRELGQPHPVRGTVPHALGGLLRQPRLPGPAGAQQRDEPGGPEVPVDGLDVGFPADEGGEPGAEVAGPAPGPAPDLSSAVRPVDGPAPLAGYTCTRTRQLVTVEPRLGVAVRPDIVAVSGGPECTVDGSAPVTRTQTVLSPVRVLSRPEELLVQRPQFRPRIGTEPLRQQSPYVLVRGQRLRRAARVAQGAQAQSLEGFVQRVTVTQGGQLGQGVFGVAEGEGGGVAGAQGVEAAGLGGPPRRCGRGGRRGRGRATGQWRRRERRPLCRGRRRPTRACPHR